MITWNKFHGHSGRFAEKTKHKRINPSAKKYVEFSKKFLFQTTSLDPSGTEFIHEIRKTATMTSSLQIGIVHVLQELFLPK